MSQLTQEQLLEQLNNLTVMEIVNLTRALETAWGVKAAPVIASVPTLVGIQPDAPAPEQTEFSVVLVEAGARKVEVIKTVRAATGLGLAEAKTVVDSLVTGGPKSIKDGLSKDEAEGLKAQFEAAGAKVELK